MEWHDRVNVEPMPSCWFWTVFTSVSRAASHTLTRTDRANQSVPTLGLGRGYVSSRGLSRQTARRSRVIRVCVLGFMQTSVMCDIVTARSYDQATKPMHTEDLCCWKKGISREVADRTAKLVPMLLVFGCDTDLENADYSNPFAC